MHCALTCTIVILLVSSAVIAYLLLWVLSIASVMLAAVFFIRRHETYQWHEYGLLGNGRPHYDARVRQARHQRWLAERRREQSGMP